VMAQCGGQIMEPGFKFLTSSRGCAPFTVQIETIYLASVPGTQYYIQWGDGGPEEVYTQTNATGVVISHNYPNYSVDCGYDVTIDASNSCNPRGTVVPIQTQVIVWTKDVVSIDPGVFRVCQGYAADVNFTDNSQWNCFPRANRENSEPRWIQWLYGTGPLASMIPGVQVNSITPGSYPYLDPAPGRNPIYPVTSPGQISLPIHVPVTTPADVGKDFFVTLKNWNQCDPYDNNLTDGNAFNPVNGDLVNGDNGAQVVSGKIVIVESPQPQYLTRLGNAAGAVQTIFCINDNIYFDNQTPPVAGASFYNTWEFYDNSTGAGAPLATDNAVNPIFSYATSGQKLIRLRVHDNNAAGTCEAVYDAVINVSPTLVAKIKVTDTAGAVISTDFCQQVDAPFTTFSARFKDASVGTIAASTQWRWEFYDENNALIRQEPSSGFSNTKLGPFDQSFMNVGNYRVKLIVRDNVTACESTDETTVRVFEKPKPDFSFSNVCEGNQTAFSDLSTVRSIDGQQIIQREWDMSYDGVTFSKDPTLDNKITFNYTLGPAGTYSVALRTATDLGGCTDMVVKQVKVDAVPIASFTPDVVSGCSVLTVNFTNNSIAGQPVAIKSYTWEIDAGSGYKADSIQRPSDATFGPLYTKKFSNTGSGNLVFHMRLRVTTVNDCEQVSAPVTITVYPGPRSGFVSTNYSPFDNNCSPVSVDFSVDNATQAMNPSDYRWTVSDANGVISQKSTGTTPAFTFSFANTTQAIKDFSVTLRAALSSGCYGDSTRIIRINPVPLSDFSFDTVQFDCTHMKIQTAAQQKGLSKYEWTIVVNAATVYNLVTSDDHIEYDFSRVAVDQNVTVELKTTNFANCQSTVTSKLFIVPKQNPISASFTVTPAVQTLPSSTVSINNTSTPGPWNFNWDLGDSTKSTDGGLTSHTYATYGTYLIKLTVSDGVCTQSQVTSVKINPIPPVIDFSYDPAAGCAPLTVSFTNLSKFADPSTYFWKFGDKQGTSHAVNPSYTYYESGSYSVTLAATNVLGDTVRLTKPLIITVYDKPNAQFALKPAVIYIPGGKLFTDNQSLGASAYEWSFGDGATSTEFQPEHVYKTDGIFDVTLIASSAQNCSDTTTVKEAVRVIKGGQILVPNAFSPSLGGPGGSGQNDIFLPLMRGVTSFHMMVFNRWGEMLFETTNPEAGWDGYYRGKLCQQDVYVYKIVAKYDNGETITKVGDINLIR